MLEMMTGRRLSTEQVRNEDTLSANILKMSARYGGSAQRVVRAGSVRLPRTKAELWGKLFLAQGPLGSWGVSGLLKFTFSPTKPLATTPVSTVDSVHPDAAVHATPCALHAVAELGQHTMASSAL